MLNSAIGNPMKYNPQLWSKDELRNIFVARQHELDDIVQRIRDAGCGQTVQHVLITGARGMGKSTLLNRVALAVHDDTELSTQWLPLRMPEEQYTVAQLGEFWLNVLDILADTLEQNQQPDLADWLDQAVAALKPLAAEAQANAARDLLLDWSRQQQKRLLLLVDGTDMLFNSLNSGTKTGSDDSQLWSLRKTLMQHPELFWVGASYQALEAHQQYSEAFHDFFEVVELRPLSLQDMRNALTALAETFGTARQAPGPEASKAMQLTLDAQPERLQTLRHISGGNPRTTVILFELFAQDGHADIHSDLKVLLDNLTPHYKARMENHLAEQPRKIMAHIMEYWRPIGLAELAEISGIAATTLSGQLKRLEQDGYIEKTKLPGTRRSGYQASERLFNIWHLMRNAPRRVRQKLSWLIEFMRLWYSSQELSSLAGQRLHAHRNGQLQRDSDLEVSLAYAAALPEDSRERYQLEHSVFLTARQIAACQQQAINQVIPGLLELDGCDSHYKTAEDYEQRLQALDALLDACPHPQTEQEREQWRQLVKQSVSLNLARKQKVAEASGTLSRFQYDELLKVFKDEEDKWQNIWGQETARLMLDAIAEGLFFPDCPNAELTYRQVLHLFEHQPKLIEWSAELLQSKKTGNAWLEKLYRLWIEGDSSNAKPWNNLGNLLQYRLKRYDEAEQAYRKAIELDDKLASPWNGLGNLLQNHLKRYDEAEQAYRKAIELDVDFASPWNNLGNLLQDHLKLYDEAEQAYRKAIELDVDFASPWNGLGNLLQDHLKRYDEAEQAYRKAIELAANGAYPWSNLGNLLKDHLKRYDEAEQAYSKAIELDIDFASPWNGLGNLLQYHLKRYDEAEQAYRKAIGLDADFASPWNGLGTLLQYHLKRYGKAEQAYRKAIELDADYASPWNGLGNLLQYHLKRYDEAEQAYRKAIELDADYASPWNGLGNLLQDHLKRYNEAEQACRKAIELDANYADPWNGLGNLLQDRLQRYQDAGLAYQQAEKLAPNDPYPYANHARLAVKQQSAETASTLYRKAAQLAQLQADQTGGIAYQDLLLQAQLYLGNRDAANLALEKLAHEAENGDQGALFCLHEQTRELSALGLGLALSDLMEQSRHAEFLQPLSLALRAAEQQPDTLDGAAQEVKNMALEVLADITAFRNELGEIRGS